MLIRHQFECFCVQLFPICFHELGNESLYVFLTFGEGNKQDDRLDRDAGEGNHKRRWGVIAVDERGAESGDYVHRSSQDLAQWTDSLVRSHGHGHLSLNSIKPKGRMVVEHAHHDQGGSEYPEGGVSENQCQHAREKNEKDAVVGTSHFDRF